MPWWSISDQWAFGAQQHLLMSCHEQYKIHVSFVSDAAESRKQYFVILWK